MRLSSLLNNQQYTASKHVLETYRHELLTTLCMYYKRRIKTGLHLQVLLLQIMYPMLYAHIESSVYSTVSADI
jgi:hypothetical protein